MVGFVVDVQLDAAFQTDSDEEASQSYCIFIVGASLQTVDYDKVIVYIVKDMLAVFKVRDFYDFYVPFLHILPFSFCKVGE